MAMDEFQWARLIGGIREGDMAAADALMRIMQEEGPNDAWRAEDVLVAFVQDAIVGKADMAMAISVVHGLGNRFMRMPDSRDRLGRAIGRIEGVAEFAAYHPTDREMQGKGFALLVEVRGGDRDGHGVTEAVERMRRARHADGETRPLPGTGRIPGRMPIGKG